MTVLVAGRRCLLPADRLVSVDLAVPAAPMAFAPPGYEGVVFSQGVAAAQIDLCALNGGEPGSGRWSLRFDGAAGPLSLRVKRIRPDESGTDEGEPDQGGTGAGPLDIDPDTLTGGLAPAAAPAQPLPALTDGAADTLDVLMVGSGGRRLAIPATLVDSVGRPGSLLTAHGASPRHRRVVALDDDLLPAHSLAGWTGGEAGPEEEGWAVRLRTPEGDIALTVAELFGLRSLPRPELTAVATDGGASLWWRAGDDGYGHPIQIIRPSAGGILPMDWPMDWPAEAAGHPARPSVRPPVRPLALPSAGHSHVAIAAGPLTLVAPATLVLEVRERPEPRDLNPTRLPGSVAAFDIDAALGGPSAPSGCVVLKRDGRRPVALLSRRIGASGASGWCPVPPLPRPLAPLIGAVRPSHPSTAESPALDCLLRPDAFNRPWRLEARDRPWRPDSQNSRDSQHTIREAMRASFAGWLSIR
ncbi:chemotaxis protein CheW [Azospirillum sp. B510]|uniref:chemotaxis protein CheW n=1 Tax=Azospirillum sp. (strain B510) TaxID=137722 RepID=UPI00030AFA8A|nr:chemotaxis protein CheW [Azospirillum sp. B510]